MSSLSKACEGCFASESCPPSSIQDTTIEKCPCVNCIVKMMCNITCMEWSDYWKKFKAWNKGECCETQ